MTLLIENLRVAGPARHPRQVAVDGDSLEVKGGSCVALLGPNGAGKSTLLRAAQGLVPYQGFSSLAALDLKTRARTCAWLPQQRDIAWPVSVRDLVALGCLPHAGDPRAAVAAALSRTQTAHLSDRDATALSGGEQARVLLARALAQQTPILLADEPIAHLDPAAQLSVMELLAGLAAEGRMVVVALHDLGLALRFCNRALVMCGGKLVADGTPRAVLTPKLLARVFQIGAEMIDTPSGPAFHPLSLQDPQQAE